MANAARSRHLYYDQQIPAEEPVDPSQGRLTQEHFSRRSPTLEDEYFYEQERTRLHLVPAIDEGEAPPEEPPVTEFSRRLDELLSRRFDLDWRP